jgi:hypothetical protein
MPFGGMLSLGAAGVGIGSSLAGLFGGTPAQNVSSMNMPNMGGAANNAYGNIGGLSNYNIGAGYLPQYQSITQNAVNNPYGQGYQSGANITGAAGMNAGAQQLGTSLSTLPDVQALMQMGFDPQQALYNRTQNQNQQQNLAMLNQSGVGSTPYGQGVADQANTNFNIDWQNAQLGRAAQAGGAAGNLLGAAGQGATTGLNQMTAGAALPYQTAQGITGDQLAALSGANQFGQSVAQLPQQQIGDYLSYLGQGTSQQQANTGLAGLQFNQSQQLGNQLGQGLAGLSKNPAINSWFGNSGGGGGYATNTWGQNNPGVAGSAFYGPAAA